MSPGRPESRHALGGRAGAAPRPPPPRRGREAVSEAIASSASSAEATSPSLYEVGPGEGEQLGGGREGGGGRAADRRSHERVEILQTREARASSSSMTEERTAEVRTQNGCSVARSKKLRSPVQGLNFARFHKI